LSVISLRVSDRRQELDTDAALVILEQFDTRNLGEVLMVTAFTRVMIRECYQQAHAFLVVLTLCKEVESFAGDIDGVRNFFKELSTR